jgi:ubiquinone/menaquinone biosynthesis C-methylase UbiE
VKLNLASGTDCKPPPWRNLDCVKRWPLADRDCDVLWDARTDAIPFPDGSADEVYCGTLFLHLAPEHHDRVLRDVYRVLEHGGRLVISEVAMDEVMRRWLANPRDTRAAELVWGEQGSGLNDEQIARLGPAGVAEQRRLSEFDTHCAGFVLETLAEFMTRAGFRDLRRITVHPSAWYELTLEARK